ncbi:MAG: hypothetical protein JWM74_3039 [Myxococcaceae bacterium]|jgi:hypothetical protein|nr:hypothetical protein [Myxococcaceae bacterium]
MPEEYYPGEDARRPDETTEQLPEPPPSAPASVPSAIPSAPDSKRERQMTDFPDGG